MLVKKRLVIIERKLDLLLSEVGFDELDEDALKRLKEVDETVKADNLDELVEL